MKKLLSLLLSALICVTIIPDYRRLICAEELTEQAPVAEVVEQVAEDLAEAADQVQQSVETFVDEAKEIVENIQENLNKEEEEVPVEKQETTEVPVSEVPEEKVPDEKENLPENNEGEETPVVQEEKEKPKKMMAMSPKKVGAVLGTSKSVELSWNIDGVEIESGAVFYYGDTDDIENISINKDLHDDYHFDHYSYKEKDESGNLNPVSGTPTEPGKYVKKAVFIADAYVAGVTPDINETFDFEIKKKAIEIYEPTQTKFEYDGNNHKILKESFFVNSSEEEYVEFTNKKDAINVGEYTRTLRIKNAYKDKYVLKVKDAGYEEAFTSKDYTVTITPKEVEFVWVGDSEFEYDGIEHYKPTANIDGLVDGQSNHFSVTVVGDQKIKNVKDGGYTYTASLTSNDESNYPSTNYKIVEASKTRTITITPNGSTR